jgi:peptidoglycan/LPS O-acetylase OafA/YrhL
MLPVVRPRAAGGALTDKAQHGFIPALDGLRGLAIIAVIISHATLYRPQEGIDRWIAAVPLVGWIGVDLFFILSGYLITGILLDTRSSRNYYSTFFARRALRIFPLYYVLLFVGLVLLPLAPELHRVIVGPYPVPPKLPYWLYLTNFSIADRGSVHGWLDVTWSLAIEEQFYIVWSVVVFLCAPRWLGALCASILVLGPLARTYAIGRGVEAEDIYVLTFFRLDGLAMGALLAWAQRHGRLPTSLKGAALIAGACAAGLLAIVVDARDSHWWTPGMQQIGFSLVALMGAAMLIAAVTRPEGALWPRMLSAGWLRAFGKYSYCLYLIHLPVLRLVREYVFEPRDYNYLFPTPWITQLIFYVLAIAPAFLLARLSWAIFEGPILKLKARFTYEAAQQPAVTATPSRASS